MRQTTYVYGVFADSKDSEPVRGTEGLTREDAEDRIETMKAAGFDEAVIKFRSITVSEWRSEITDDVAHDLEVLAHTLRDISTSPLAMDGPSLFRTLSKDLNDLAADLRS